MQYIATMGKVAVNGRISALLELGAGFHPERTGLENLYFQGAIQGFSRRETEAMIPDIVAFADIGDFINQPVKVYSSGMFIRLAFAAAVQVKPDILIVDEALSVGDARFQRRCFARIGWGRVLLSYRVCSNYPLTETLSIRSICPLHVFSQNAYARGGAHVRDYPHRRQTISGGSR